MVPKKKHGYKEKEIFFGKNEIGNINGNEMKKICLEIEFFHRELMVKWWSQPV